MRLFSHLYRRVMHWSHHRHAGYYLGVVSFIESSIFPIPPDVMLAPMSLARPERAWWYATLTTFTSVLGAVFGYYLGWFFFHWIEPWFNYMGYMPAYYQVQSWFMRWGGWIIFIAGFSPIPFKLFTVSAGALHLAMLPFLIGSLLGRGMRFYLVAGLMRWGGKRIQRWLEHFIDRIGWAIVVILIIGYGVYNWFR